MSPRARIRAYLDECYEPAPADEIARAAGVSSLAIVVRYLRPMQAAGEALCVEPHRAGRGGTCSRWVAGPAPEGWES